MRATMDRSVPFSVILLVLVFGFVKVDEYRLKKKKKKEKEERLGWNKKSVPSSNCRKKKKKSQRADALKFHCHHRASLATHCHVIMFMFNKKKVNANSVDRTQDLQICCRLIFFSLALSQLS